MSQVMANKGFEGLFEIPGLTIRKGEPLSRHTTFKIGGPAELFVEVENEAALSALLLTLWKAGEPFQLLGLGSNILIPDAGLSGVVARLGKAFKQVSFGENEVTAGAALALPTLARQTARKGFTGLEPLCGFPSTVGGAVWMNAGCYGTEIKDVMIDARLVDRAGGSKTIGVEELGAGYRSTALQGTDWIVTSARFRLEPADAAECTAKIEQYNTKRWSSLPYGVGNAGSIFKNPPGDYAGRLIEACGLKGKVEGGAEISSKHANVIVNHGSGMAEDVFALMLEARRAVEAKFGITLKPEVILAGELGKRWGA